MTPSISRLQSHYQEKVYFLSFSSQEFQILNWSTSDGWKDELTLQPFGGFELDICLTKWNLDSFLLWELQKSAC